MNKRFILGFFIFIFIGILGLISEGIQDIEDKNYTNEKNILINDQFITVLNGQQICELNKGLHNDISCKFIVDDSEDYKFYQDFIVLELKPELENMIGLIYNNGSELFKDINDWNFVKYEIYYKDILLIEYKPNWGNDITFTKDIFKPFLDHFPTTATFEFIPRDAVSIFEPQFYNNSIFEKVTLHAYFTNFLDKDGNEGKAGWFTMQNKTVDEIYYDIPNDGVGHSIWHGYSVSLENKVVSYETVITQIDIGEEIYTFEHKFDYDAD